MDDISLQESSQIMTKPATDLQAIFAHALDLKTPAERARYVIEACGDDRALRGEVESLLRALGNAGDFLENPVMSTNTVDQSRAAKGPDRSSARTSCSKRSARGDGGRLHGRADAADLPQGRPQDHQTGDGSRQVIARFEAERQALAMMDHPNIAKVLDAGTTESGCPYFVMELVKGIPITQYCDQANLNLRERLALLDTRVPCHSARPPERDHPP